MATETSRRRLIVLVITLLLQLSGVARGDRVAASWKVDTVWAGHPVGFALLTQAPWQYVAYYDGSRQLVVASRRLTEDEWTRTALPEHVVWDSHNSIKLAMDADHFLHLSGNMHVSPLVYFRSREPYLAPALTRSPMVGSLEARSTYPDFFTGPGGQFMFTYRDGSSGNGNQIYNRYDLGTQTWSRLLDGPLVDGEGARNAYFSGPVTGPDGYYHLCWVWRDTPDCATNHDLSYARSRDLIHWETSGGEALRLPITYATAEIVDPAPPGGGMINGNNKVGFDADGRVILSYHKYDDGGNTQIYNARREAGGWEIYQATDWDIRWDFSGGGSIPFQVRVQPVKTGPDQTLVQGWSHWIHGGERWSLDPEHLQAMVKLPPAPQPYPPELRRVRGSAEGLTVHLQRGQGQSEENGQYYVLRWETLGPNRDRPRPEPWPAPGPLEVYRMEAQAD